MWLGRLARGALLPRARLAAPPLIEAKPLLRSAQSGGATLRRLLSTSAGTASGESGGAGGAGGALKSWAQFGLSLGAFVAADQLLKKSLKEAGVTFPASLVGMFGILVGLLGLAAAGRLAAAETVIGAASPAMAWVQRYLPVFYTPPLIVLPLAIQNMSSSDLMYVGGILLVGMPASCLFAASLVLGIRRLTGVAMLPISPGVPPTPFGIVHMVGCALVAAAGALGLTVAERDSPAAAAGGGLFLAAATVGGLIFGSVPPAVIAPYLPHPVVACVVFAQAGCAIAGQLSGRGYWAELKGFLTKGKDGALPGPGDLLMGFLGVVVLTFGFQIFSQRALLRRHAGEVLGCAALASLASMAFTCVAGRALGLPADLSLAIAPRSVTVALAMPIAEQLGTPEHLIAITASSVLVTGLVGAMGVQRLLTIFGFADPLSRGLATASSCHGFGVAALAATEPQAMPMAALGYGLTGIAASLWVAVPPVRDALRTFAGAAD